MFPTIEILISLLAVIAAISLLARRLEVPPAILLVAAGVALALIPGAHSMQVTWQSDDAENVIVRSPPIDLQVASSNVTTTMMASHAANGMPSNSWPVAAMAPRSAPMFTVLAITSSTTAP